MADTVWDERLMTQAEAYKLAGRWPVHFEIHAVCEECGQSAGLFASSGRPARATSPDDFVGAVLRHLVTAHDVETKRDDRDDAQSRPA
jgi:hypothetical protein